MRDVVEDVVDAAHGGVDALDTVEGGFCWWVAEGAADGEVSGCPDGPGVHFLLGFEDRHPPLGLRFLQRPVDGGHAAVAFDPRVDYQTRDWASVNLSWDPFCQKRTQDYVRLETPNCADHRLPRGENVHDHVVAAFAELE